ncbi:DNA replication endonuclease-helicase Dna2, partial [Dipsacomyces acuminosporus]
EWAKDYMHGSSALGSQHLTHRGSTPADMKATVAISKIINTEENVWSPKFGLKGKVDLTVLSRYSGMGAFVEPLELKTGRNTTNTAHRAQLILYTLLLSERYGIDIRSGLLYFPRSGELIRVPRYDDELRGLIAARNELTTYLVHTTQTSRPLPDPIGHEYECKRCSFRPSCFIAHRALERGSEESAQMPKDVWESQVGHLADSHLEFLRTWMRLLDSEEGDMLRFRSELWNMNSEYRELQTGHCLSNMKLEVHSIEDTGVIGSYSRYKQTFVPATRDAHRSLLDSQISVGDPITVSSESGQYAFTLGYVFSLEYSSITLVLERPVRGTPKHVAGFDPKCNQDFESILEIRQRGTSRQQEETILHPVVPQSASEDTYRIDKDELSTGMSKIRANIMRLFIADIGDSKRCRLIVDLQQPSFSPLGEELEQKVQAVQYERRLNAGQASVLRKVLSANDYALVMGMPGTGKTTTIAELVEVLVAQGKSVLLASYTHVAVDNILLKLQERDIPMIRLGNRNKVHPRIVQHLPSETKFESVQQLDSYFRKAPVVATTCLGINHPVFTVRTFDYCIVDEASQITLPVCLGPLFVANTFVLVGDHHQLPPLVRNTAARDAGLGASLFKRLCEAHPSAVVRLEYQYRMNSDIQRLANNMIYDGHLRCGSLKVANQKIKYKSSPEAVIDKWPFAQEKPNPQFRMPWAVDALDPTRGAVFIDTDLLPGRESRVEGYDVVLNDTEIKVIKVLTTVLQGCGVDGRQVGILSAYRIQLKQLEIEYGIRFDADGKLQAPPSSRQLPSIADATTSRSSSGNASTEATPNADALCYTGIEMHTIDRYQGRDADVVVISWVRSNVGQAIGDLLRDWHRINVAITRARYKLIMVGSKSTLSRSPLLAGMLQAISRDGGLIRIPANTVLPVTTAYSRSIARKNSGTGTGSNRAGSALLRNMPVASNIVSE